MWATPTADSCGPVVDSVRFCTAPDGHPYPVLVNGGAVAGPRPGIGGALQVGSTLTVVDGVWDPADATLTHQWLRNDVPVLGATGPTYLLTTADLGKGIRVKTTAAAPSYKDDRAVHQDRPCHGRRRRRPVCRCGVRWYRFVDTHPDRPSRLVYGWGDF